MAAQSKTNVALCSECQAQGLPAWHDPQTSGEWGLCATHVITALTNQTPASDGVTV